MELTEILKELGSLTLTGLYEKDFYDLTAKDQQELAGIFAVADTLKGLRERNYATVLFRSGLAIWEGAEEEGCAAFAAACVMLGLRVVRSERLTARTLVEAQADVLCPSEDRGGLCDQLYRQGELTQRPLSLPRRTALPLLLDVLHENGGVAQMWGKELSVSADAPQDAALLAQRFGMSVAVRPEPEERQVSRGTALEPYVLAAMILLGKCPDPVGTLTRLQRQGEPRRII